ncbi:MAG TPA: FHA domain-containing protein [Myxococcales bacterium]|nr:FHA domain-containing protein [Myxococcales bacterium]
MNREASIQPPPRLSRSAPSRVERTCAEGLPAPTVLGGEGNSLRGTARLLVTAGPGKGAELALGSGWATLGRGAGNTLVIPDISVSRRHARIEERGAAIWVVIDEGSGNGTRVNGRPVRERRLRDGDEVAVGDTRVRFLEPGGMAARRPRPPEAGAAHALRARLLLGAAALGLVLAAGYGVHRWRKARPAAPEDAVHEQARTRVAVDRDTAARIEAQPAPPSRPPDPPPVRLASTPAKTIPARPGPTPTPPRKRRRTPAPSSGKPAPDAEVEAIVAAYRRGDLAAARQRALESRAPEAARLLAALKDFERACRHAAAQQTPADALSSLEAAAAADRAIAGSGESRLGGEVRKALSAQHLLAAAALKADDQLPQAAVHLRAAAEANPSNPGARDALRRLQDRARDLYLRGYVAKEAEPAEARRCFGLVVQALPASDETAQKAKRWLDKIGGKAAE